MTLYLKYRPQVLEDLDLADVRETLKSIVKSDQLPHAFLFSGPKGTGKTSAARILAKILNCENRKEGELEPCNKCATCKAITRGESLDVFELDAASNRGIDDIRTLREAVKLATAGSKKKIYIIDEAHMLTTEASNALLKTLEEPPEHVVFMLATTNPEKLIDTIRSRTVQVNFKKAVFTEIVRSLKRITKGEDLKVDDNTLELIAKASKGSLRDSHKILDQILSQGLKLEKSTIEKFLFKSDVADPEVLLKLISDKKLKEALDEIEKVSESGVGMDVYLESLLEDTRNSLRAKIGIGNDKYSYINKDEIVALIKLFEKSYRMLKNTYIEQLGLEVALVEYLGSDGMMTSGNKDPELKEIKKASANIVQKDTNKIGKNDNAEAGNLQENGNGEKDEVAKQKEASPGSPDSAEGAIAETTWMEIIASIKPQNTSTEALLRASRPIKFDGKTLTLGVYYSFHKEKLEALPHRLLLEKTVEAILGSPVRVSCTLAKPPQVSMKNDNSVNSEDKSESDAVLTEVEDEEIVNVAKEIFGS